MNVAAGVKPDAQRGVALPPGHSGASPRLRCVEWALTTLTRLPAPTRKTSFSSVLERLPVWPAALPTLLRTQHPAMLPLR